MLKTLPSDCWFTLLLAAALASSGCTEVVYGSGNVVSASGPLSEFDAVEACCDFEVEIRQGAEPEMSITTDDNLLELISITVDGRTLKIEKLDDCGDLVGTVRPKIELKTANVNRIKASGGAFVKSSTMTGDRIDIDASGGAVVIVPSAVGNDVDIDLSGGSRVGIDLLDAKKTDIDSSGGSEIYADGRSDEASIDLSGGGWFGGHRLDAQTAKVEVSGGSYAEVLVSGSLDVKASGGSEVRFCGDPQLTLDTSGGSIVGKLGE